MSAEEQVKTADRKRLLTRLRTEAPVLYFALPIWLVLEALAVLLLPAFVPRHVALSWYLGAEARHATRCFLEDRQPFLTYDPLIGWRNRPGCEQDNWKIDDVGSRSTHPLDLEKRRPQRLLFLGNSLINGGFGVKTAETISACCEDSTTEAGNFATMMHSLDQMVLAYAGDLHRFGADVVVAGLSAQPGVGLSNRYLPFLQRSQERMPYFKPRFVQEGENLRLVPVPTLDQWRTLLRSPRMIDSIGVDEGCLYNFESYRRFGLTPLAAGLRHIAIRTQNLHRLRSGNLVAMPLVCRLMHMLADEALARHARAVFMLLPSRRELAPPPWRRILPDYYDSVLAAFRRERFLVLDGRALLRASGLPPERLYAEDGVHFQPEANRVLAAGLRDLLRTSDVTSRERSLPQRTEEPGDAPGSAAGGASPGSSRSPETPLLIQ